MMKKLMHYIKLSAKQNNLGVQLEKIKYPFTRLFGNVYSMGDALKKNAVVNTPYGVFYVRKRRNDLHIISPHYEFEIIEIFKNILKDSSVVLDVGAHIGKYGILSAKMNPKAKIYSFEASKDNFEILKKNKEINKAKNLEIINKALSDEKGVKRFYFSGVGVTIHKRDNFELVKTETLDNFVRNNKIKEIGLIKIDIDGGEDKFILGGKKTFSSGKVKNIIIEMNDQIPYAIEFFKKNGYKIKKIRHNNFFITK